MKTEVNCPAAEELRQLLEGTLSDQQQAVCSEHLDTCECCQTKLEGIATGGSNLSKIVQTVRESEVSANSGYWPAVRILEATIDETFVPAKTPRSATPTLDFLQPAEDSAYLGRLAQFDVMRIIGRGGMGLVLEAFDTRLQRNVAVKVLDPDLAGDDTARQRFCREARAAASVTHENVVAVHQVEKSGENGLPYLVMQLISGESLEERLQRKERLPLREVIRISMQAAHGLSAAYAQGLIHRDIKPGNILIEKAHDNVKLTDFGLARAVDDVKLTRTGFVSGTPLYMAPEQAMGEEADHRSDLFSLGAIMYEMCAGQPPFMGNSALAILRQITDTKHRPLREVNPEVPEWFAETIDQLLSKNPDDRIQSAALLAELLEFQFALMKTSEDIPTVCRIELDQRAKRNRLVATAIGVGFLVVGLLAGVLISNRSTGPLPAAMEQASTKAAEVESIAPIAILNGSSTVWASAFDPTNKTAVMALEDGVVRLWDIESKSIKSQLNAHRGAVWSAKFSRKGDLLATAGEDGKVHLWDLVKSDPIRTFEHPNAVRSIMFSHDDKLLITGDRMGGLRVWSLDNSEKPLLHAEQPTGSIYAIAISPDDDTIATASSDKIIRLWNAKNLSQKLTLEGHSGSVYGLSFNKGSGSRLASAGWDDHIRVWDTATGTLINAWDGKGDDIWNVCFSPDNKRLVTGDHEGAVKLWNADTGDLIQTYHGHKNAVHSVAFNKDGTLIISGGRDGTMRIWPVPTTDNSYNNE